MNRTSPWVRLVLIMLAAGIAGGCTTKQLQEENDRLVQENLDLRNELDGAQSALSSAERRASDAEAALAAAQSQAAAGPAKSQGADTGFGGIAGVEATREGGEITVRVEGDILFDSGKVSLKSSSLRTLNQVAGVIKTKYGGKRIRINGFTDTDPIRKSGWKDNLELSLQRAAAVHRHLQKQGIAGEEMVAAGLGQWHPAESKKRSRRVEIVVVLY